MIACHTYATAFTVTWAPTSPSFVVLQGHSVRVFHVTASHIACVQLVPDMEPDYEHSRASLTCRWDPSGRFVVVLSKWNGSWQQVALHAQLKVDGNLPADEQLEAVSPLRDAVGLLN
ncbi:hypothetical protein WJX84_002905 [Apatococcus fuscideae]|uniref:Uncharacterized protein n=1 Tax=Apatococcus fuscideae TaxID=2026836 RepID=A0AAW1SPI9_9CHLO